MGYYTDYNLSTDSYDNENIIDEFKQSSENAKYALESESCKWYDHEKELRKFSKKYPDVLFTLYGQGEEHPDIWYKYFKNGLMQKCEAIITYPKYNESELS